MCVYVCVCVCVHAHAHACVNSGVRARTLCVSVFVCVCGIERVGLDHLTLQLYSLLVHAAQQLSDYNIGPM